MAFVPDTPDVIEAAILADFANRFVGRDLSTESFLGKQARALAQGFWTFQKKLQRISLDSIPSDQSTYDSLADYAVAYGLSDGQGGFGPLLATAATGLEGTATGSNGATISDGTQLVAPDGVTLFEVVNGAPVYTISGGVATIEFNALTAGTAGNLSAGTVTFVSPPVGVNSTVTLTVGAENGTDKESLSHLAARILERLQNPPKGGAQADWDVWALTAVTSVNRSYGYARRNGTGTVDEVVTYAPNAAGTGASRQVSAGDLATITAYVLTVRPVTVEGYRILTPYLPPGFGLSLRTRIVPYPAGAFDWDDVGYNLTVDTYTPGSPATLKVSTIVSDTLKDAIDAGLQPRVQVISTNGNPINGQVRATDWSDGGGKTTLELEDPLPPDFTAPTAGDDVYAGGPSVIPIAEAQLAYVNELGPSRVSGYADPNDVWNDSVETEQLGRIALEAENDTGDPLAKNIVKVASVPQITIAVGGNAPTTDDYETSDNSVEAPEIARAIHIAVTA